MAHLSKSWAIPIIILGIILAVLSSPSLLGSMLGLLFLSQSKMSAAISLEKLVAQTIACLIALVIGIWLIKFGRKLRLTKQTADDPNLHIENAKVSRRRTNFYIVLALTSLPFFILHWNGLFDFTYYWYLVRVDGTHEFRPQIVAALVSSVIIFGLATLFFELGMRAKKRILRPNQATGTGQTID